jgi:hypothetical protein
MITITGDSMSLDETSRTIGRLEANVAELEKRTASMDVKLDRLLARSAKVQLTVKHWVMLIAGGSVGGGGIAHALKRLLE